MKWVGSIQLFFKKCLVFGLFPAQLASSGHYSALLFFFKICLAFYVFFQSFWSINQLIRAFSSDADRIKFFSSSQVFRQLFLSSFLTLIEFNSFYFAISSLLLTIELNFS